MVSRKQVVVSILVLACLVELGIVMRSRLNAAQDLSAVCHCPKCDPTIVTPPTTPTTSTPSTTPSQNPSLEKPSAPAQDVVMGLAKGIQFPFLQRFLQSIRRFAPLAKIVIWIDKESYTREISDLVALTKTEAILMDPSDLPTPWATMHPSSYRYLLYQQYFNKSSPSNNHPQRVLLLDARDCVFQMNPFEYLNEDAFYAFLERRGRSISQCGWNRGWVADCFGNSVANSIGDKTICCSGTSGGSWEAVKRYVDLQVGELLSRQSCERNGVDQGVHNVLVHTNKITPLRIIANEDGPIAQMQEIHEVKLDLYGRLVNGQGKPYAIIHQYDRFPKLVKILDGMYPVLEEAQRDAGNK
eukprot:gnl/Trimastix_PCT/2605.p1 GENE.gnl/Trimastix_PCT/2605~~gnl/Trimastix_PCT/2605.p1  ORF type:complete len:356 (+),score=22.02 gnl/Trimastix_PCT/2605:57-1124(+)